MVAVLPKTDQSNFSVSDFYEISFWLFPILFLNKEGPHFPGGAVVENLPANAGDAGSSPGLGRSHMPRSN